MKRPTSVLPPKPEPKPSGYWNSAMHRSRRLLNGQPQYEEPDDELEPRYVDGYRELADVIAREQERTR